jgi:tripartite-type tricarboxylate transporter receptor subunit TctC
MNSVKRVMMIKLLCAVLCLAGVMSFAVTVLAQNYPSGPMRMVIPFPPGGGTDILGRVLAQKLSEAWGVPVIVDNRGGANGTMGAAVVAKSPPDGQTLLLVPSGFAVNPSIYKSLPFDSLKDLAPVTQLAESPLIVTVNPSFPPRSIKELIAHLKANPDKVNYGSSGNGSPPHLATELFKYMTETKMTHVPYKGAGPAAVDVISGYIQVYFMNALQAVPHIKGGKLRALAATSEQRFQALPEIPTIAEAGVPGYAMTNWYGMLMPGGTPKSMIAKVHAEVVRIMKLPDMKDRLVKEGATVIASTPDEFMAFLKKEMATNARIVQVSGMSVHD